MGTTVSFKFIKQSFPRGVCPRGQIASHVHRCRTNHGAAASATFVWLFLPANVYELRAARWPIFASRRGAGRFCPAPAALRKPSLGSSSMAPAGRWWLQRLRSALRTARARVSATRARQKNTKRLLNDGSRQVSGPEKRRGASKGTSASQRNGAKKYTLLQLFTIRTTNGMKLLC